ncbi:MAG: hypothetical protein CBC05_03585 [Crocinitomicaceae bacterium TMED45]|nr:MAG: hypothetical protein CBC05_03585 [Crocinitomicaceae bacterium TMED45]|tara:strand:- start:2512 stop:4929 length:2418 start_codon:yes stop_codon:yes gene_type:complete
MSKALFKFLPLAIALTAIQPADAGTGCVVMEADTTWANYSSVELFTEGSILMEEEFWHEAERVWAYAMKTRPKNRVAKFKRAVCMSEIGEDWPATKALLEEVTQGGLTLRYDPFNPNQILPPVDAWLWLANAEHRTGEFDLARKHVDSFLAKAGERHGSTEWASKILAEVRFAERQLDNPTDAFVSSMSINSEGNETHPVLTADGQIMFFSSDRARSNGSNHGRVDPNTKTHYFDIYRTELQQDSTWEEPEYLNMGIRNHAKVIGSDAFGQKLIVLDDDGWTHELKTTELWERGWTVAEPFYLDRTIPKEGEIVFFPNKNRLIASVKMRRGEGGFDLFESALDAEGRWSKLKSLGTRVNTWGDEITPFVAADGVTVFFASNGLQSMGGLDVYRTTRNAAGGWTVPEHLGAPINSVDDDMAFVIGAKGEVGYLASRRDVKRGDLQLFEVSMNGAPSLEQEVVILALDAENLDNDVQPELLIVKDANTGDVIQRVERENTEDVFNLILPTGRDYVVESAEAPLPGDDAVPPAPAIRRTLKLSEDLAPEVIVLTFEEVFQEVESTDEPQNEVVENVADAAPFVVRAPEKVNADEALVMDSDTEEAIVEEAIVEETPVEEAPVDQALVAESTPNPEVVNEEAAVAAEKPAAGSITPAKEGKAANDGDVMQFSAPLAPMALAAADAGLTVMAIQLYSGQVHTDRMDMTRALDFIVAQSAKGKPVVRIEGSASDGPSSRAGGNMELASSRAMDVCLRLVDGLVNLGLEKGRDYEVNVVRRVQPDGDTPASFVQGEAHPASFQYVRVDVDVR